MTDLQMEQQRARSAKYRANNRDASRESSRLWRERNRDADRAKRKRYKALHPEAIREAQRRYYQKNAAKRKAATTAWRRANPERAKGMMLKCVFGITLDDYKRMLAEQDGVCAICHREETETAKSRWSEERHLRNLSVDHDHATGKVRGLLCTSCNKALGALREDPEIMRGMLSYVLRSRQ